MVKGPAILVFFAFLGCSNVFAQSGPCSTQSSKLACVIPEEYGLPPSGSFITGPFGFGAVLFPVGGHPEHFSTDFENKLQPLSVDLARQANVQPLASPSSGIILTYDPSLKTFTTSTDSLGPVLGERAETVGRHRLFIGFSYEYFNFDKLDGVNLQNFQAELTHTDDPFDNSSSTSKVTCSITTTQNLGGCGFVRDRINTVNSLSLRVNQYTSYITFGLTRRVDVSVVIPVDNVRMSLTSQDMIVLGTNGMITPTPNSPDARNANQNTTNLNGQPYFFHLFKDCPNTSPSSGPSGLDPICLHHTFPDPTWIGSSSSPNGSSPYNSASGIGDVIARVKWNAWEGERAGFAAGLDVRFPSGDALNYLGSGAYGVKPFVVFSYRWVISPHVLVGYEWNSDSISAGDLGTGTKGGLPSDLTYSVGADGRITKWLTGAFDIIGQRVFSTTTLSEAPTAFLNNCGMCTSNPTPATVMVNDLTNTPNQSYNITNASMGIKARPFPHASRLVVTANVLVRLDDGGLKSKASPLVGIGYTF
jgi:hypothetical protein